MPGPGRAMWGPPERGQFSGQCDAETADKDQGRKGHSSDSQEVCPTQAAGWRRLCSVVHGRGKRQSESFSWVTEGTDVTIVENIRCLCC